jgi:AAA domain
MTFEPLSGHFPHIPVPPVPSAPPSLPANLLLSDIPTTPLTWLWPARLPLGYLTLLDAAPGCNPSLFALTLAARISRGSPLPDGSPTPQGNVLLFAPYDSASSTLKPHLQAAGGDPAHVLLFRPTTPTFSLPRDLPQLAAAIRLIDARLLILDPASAIAGLTRSLAALVELAQQDQLRHPPHPLLARTYRQPPALTCPTFSLARGRPQPHPPHPRSR